MRGQPVLVGVGVVAGVALVLLAAAWGLQRRLIYFPSGGPVPPAATVLPGARDVALTTSDGLSLGAWYAPAPGPATLTVLVANGNAGDRADRAPLARALTGRGLGVLLFDYRGYGGNPGSPSEDGLARDVRAARRFLVEDAGVGADRLLYYGESLGAAVVAELAVEHPPAGLLLRSPFTSLAAAGRDHYPFLPVGTLLWDRYATAEHVAGVDVPVAVVYGTADSIVAPRLSREVAAAAGGRVRLVAVEGADHNDAVLLDGERLVDAVLELARLAAG